MTVALATSEKQRLIRYATLASVVAASSIIVGKTLAWWLTGSVSLLASLVDSVLDVIVSAINFMAVRYAMQPPDKEHRFGHGKAEDLAAFAQASFIVVSGILVGIQAVKRFVFPEEAAHTLLGIGVMLFSTVVTLLLVAFQRYVIARTKSPVIEADSLHYMNDILMNGVVIFSLVSAPWLDLPWIDAFFAFLIAFYIIFGAWDIGVSAFHDLMDREFKEESRQRIKELIARHPAVKGWHRLKTRSSGGKPFIQFDLELDGSITLREAHNIADEIEQWIIHEFPEAEVLIHQDPV